MGQQPMGTTSSDAPTARQGTLHSVLGHNWFSPSQRVALELKNVNTVGSVF